MLGCGGGEEWECVSDNVVDEVCDVVDGSKLTLE